MFSQAEFEKAKSIFSLVGEGKYHSLSHQHHVALRPKDLYRWMNLLKDDLGYLTLVSLTGAKMDGHFELLYHYLNMGNHQRLNLHVHFREGEVVPSIVEAYPNADWFEREVAEQYPVQFDRSLEKLSKSPWVEDEPLPKLNFNPNKSELPFPEEAYVWKRFSIMDQETQGHFQWTVCFDPVKTVRSFTEIGFHHQTLEELFEGRNWLQLLPLVDRLNLSSAPTYSLAWVRLLEETQGIRIPERAQALRIVMLELARIADHLTVLAEVALALKKNEFRYFIDIREKIYEIFENYTGHRQGVGLMRLGGLSLDLPHGWIVEYQRVAQLISKHLVTVMNSLLVQSDFQPSLSGHPVDAQTILKWGLGGPTMRATGINFDLRKSQPFYFYRDIDFEIPVGIYGTAYDRVLIRYEEIFQSLRIITQVIDNLPLGGVVNEEISPFDAERGLHDLSMKGWTLSTLESPNGEAGFIHYSWKQSPQKIRIKSPSFGLVQALPELTLGIKQDQLRAAVGSLGIRRAELDR